MGGRRLCAIGIGESARRSLVADEFSGKAGGMRCLSRVESVVACVYSNRE